MQLDLSRGSRTKLLAIILLSVMVIFVLRLFYLQIVRHDYYVKQAHAEQMKQLRIPAQRGEIYTLDNGVPAKLVLNQTVYTVFADPSIVKNPEKIAETIRRVAGGNARQNLMELLDRTTTRYQILATKVSRKQAELIKQAELTGVGFQAESQRVYPEGQLAAQTLGFVNAEGKGQYGVESGLDTRLRGSDGLLKTVVDVSGIPLTIGNQNVATPAKNGDDIVLSLDRNIQAYTERALQRGMEKSGATKGSAVVMDPQTGRVLSMANFPTYSPAEFHKVTDASAFNNGVIATPYEPGSVMKTFTAAMGIDKGVITPDSTYVNNDKVVIDGWTIGNATKGQTGTISLQHALNWSLNTGFVTIAQRLGDGRSVNRQARDTMYRYSHEVFRLGQPTGIEVSGEAGGEIIPPTEHEGNAVRYANISFGQGMNLTMIQIAAGFSAIVNGGTYYKPTVLAGQMKDGEWQKPSVASGQRILSATTAATTKQMVHDARAEFYAGSDRKGYDIGGKTGTSQTLINGSYDNDQTIGSYLGYGGAETPRYVIMVQVSSPGKNFAGNRDALPIFTDISNWMIDYMKLQPKR